MKTSKVVYAVHQDSFCHHLKKFAKATIAREQLSQLKGGQDSIGIVDLVDG